MALNGHNGKQAQKVIIYWDYENCPIPKRASSFGTVYNVIKRRIFAFLGTQVPVDAKVYIAAKKLPNKIKQGMDVCGAHNIDIPSWKPEAVDKRILVDLALDLYQWKGHNICNAVVLISGDKDFGNLLGKIQNTPEIAKLILIRLPKNDGTELPVNRNLYACVDYIVDKNNGSGFSVDEFIDCKFGMNCNKAATGGCKFYHHNMQMVQSPVSSVSNMSVSNDDEKKMDPKTVEIRKQIPCKFGNKCKNWQKGNCHYLHAAPYNPSHAKAAKPSGSNKPCKFGQKCTNWRKGPGHCKFYHAYEFVAPITNPPKAQWQAAAQPPAQPPAPPQPAGGPPPPNPYQIQQQIQQQQVLAQQQPQHIQSVLHNNGNSNQNQGQNQGQNQNDTLTYSQLKDMNTKKQYPVNIDKSKLETYLSDAEFKQYFEMSKSEFSKLPQWKQKGRKRELGLF